MVHDFEMNLTMLNLEGNMIKDIENVSLIFDTRIAINQLNLRNNPLMDNTFYSN